MKKILITGSNGLLGQSLLKVFKNNFYILGCDLSDKHIATDSPPQEYYRLDTTVRDDVKRFFSTHRPDMVINTAAYTDVDRSEDEKDSCWTTNVKSVENIIEAVREFSPVFIQISSDYVFNGNSGFYREDDKPDPLGYYGHTKLSAEKIVMASGLEYIIGRTMILYGTGENIRPNFVTWVIDQLNQKKSIKIVNDQIGNPTFVDDLSEALLRLVERSEYGIFHISGSETCTRYEFAMKIAQVFNLEKALIHEIITKVLNQKAPRPMNSSFILDKLSNAIDWLPPSIEKSLLKLKTQLV